MKRPAQLSSNGILIHGTVAGGGGGSSRFIWMTSGGTPSLSKHSWIRGVCSDVPAFVSHVSRLGLSLSLLSAAGLARGLWVLLIFSKLLVLLIFSIHFSVFNSVDFC